MRFIKLSRYECNESNIRGLRVNVAHIACYEESEGNDGSCYVLVSTPGAAGDGVLLVRETADTIDRLIHEAK